MSSCVSGGVTAETRGTGGGMRGDTRGGTQAAREAGRMGGQPRWVERAVAGGKEPGRSRSERQRGRQWPAGRVAAGGGAASQNASSQRTLRGLLGAPPLPAHMHICDRVPSKCALDRLHPPTPYLVIALRNPQQTSLPRASHRASPCAVFPIYARSFPDLKRAATGTTCDHVRVITIRTRPVSLPHGSALLTNRLSV